MTKSDGAIQSRRVQDRCLIDFQTVGSQAYTVYTATMAATSEFGSDACSTDVIRDGKKGPRGFKSHCRPPRRVNPELGR